MTQLWRITNQGNNAGGDVFAHSIYVTDAGSATIAQVTAAAVTAQAQMCTVAGNMLSFYRPETVWAGVIVEQINPADGSVYDSLVGAASHAGTDTTHFALPGEVANVCTWRTGRPDRSGRGRWYLPAPTANALTTVGRYITAYTTAVVVSVNAYLASLKAAVPALTPVVFSPTHHETNVITGWDVGDVPDAQRRRRNKLVESRTAGVV
jgi:hypothetical protein